VLPSGENKQHAERLETISNFCQSLSLFYIMEFFLIKFLRIYSLLFETKRFERKFSVSARIFAFLHFPFQHFRLFVSTFPLFISWVSLVVSTEWLVVSTRKGFHGLHGDAARL